MPRGQAPHPRLPPPPVSGRRRAHDEGGAHSLRGEGLWRDMADLARLHPEVAPLQLAGGGSSQPRNGDTPGVGSSPVAANDQALASTARVVFGSVEEPGERHHREDRPSDPRTRLDSPGARRRVGLVVRRLCKLASHIDGGGSSHVAHGAPRGREMASRGQRRSPHSCLSAQRTTG